MSAGFAAADVSVSGDARMGVVSTDGVATFSNRARIKFSGSGTTDGGLAFGGSFRSHESVGANAGTSGSAFISGAFGKITMGSVDSGDAASVGQLASVGFAGLGSGNSISYAADAGGDNGLPGALADAGGAKVLYTYSAGALTVNASTAQMTDGGATAYGIGGSYAAGALTVGLGYGVVDGGRITGLRVYDAATVAGVAATGTVDLVGAAYVAAIPAVNAGFYETTALDASVTDLSLSVAYVMDNTTIKAIYQTKTLEASAAARAAVTTSAAAFVHDHNAIALSTTATSMGMSIVQKMDALSLTAYGINTTVDADSDLSADDPTVSRYGIGFGYDLGGGASVAGGWATVDALVATAIAGTTNLAQETYTLTSVSHDQFDLGVSFSF
jgi:outer membrane protein OmpU